MTISAILTTYDSGAMLEEALESVLGQTRPPDEIIVVDDGSTDDTAARLQRFGDRVRYQWQVNGGSSVARNTGWQMARSSWIAYLDADDLWLPEKLQQQEAWLADHSETEAVFGQVQNFASPGCEAQFDPEINHLHKWLPGWSPGTVLIRRTVLERVDFDPRQRYSEVIDWIIRLRECGTSMTMLEIPMLRRRLHASNKGRQHDDARPENLQLLRDFISRKKLRAPATGQAP